MMDVGVLTFGAPGADGSALRRNAGAEIEGKLRAVIERRGLRVVFGSEPSDPADRAIDSLRLGRIHLHHVLQARPCIVVALLAGPPDPNVVTAVVRYLDSRATPPVPLAVLAVEAAGGGPCASVLAVSAELQAVGRRHETAVVALDGPDPRRDAFCDRLGALLADARLVAREIGFKDDLRRHHHVAVCPSGRAPLSWRLDPLAALSRHGLTVTALDADAVRRRASSLLGPRGEALDPRLLAVLAGRRSLEPGDLRDAAVAQAIRDLADERLATTVALGLELPGGAEPTRVARALRALVDAAGRPVPQLVASASEDDAGALSQALLQRASIDGAPGAFVDPAQRRPAHAAITLAVRSAGDRAVVLALRPDDPEPRPLLDALAAGPVTAVRVAFHAPASVACTLETLAPATVADDAVALPLPGRADDFLRRWPADRMALLPGAHARRLATLLATCGFRVDRFPRG